MRIDQKEPRLVRIARIILKGGLFCALVYFPWAESPSAITLHGVTNAQDAIQAVRSFGELQDTSIEES